MLSVKAALSIKPDDDAVWERYEAGPRNLDGDAGFDLYVPKTVTFGPKETKLVSMGVSCAMNFILEDKKEPTSYYLYSRSSIGKTPLRLANGVGIIDKGYRGAICAMLDNIRDEPYTLEAGSRIVQICAPGLVEIASVVKVDSLPESIRGARGFGST